MKRAAVYCRVSTWEQAQHGYSIHYQNEILPEYARAQGFIVEPEDIFSEVLSGANDERPEYNRMLTLVVEGKYQAVFVAEKSRLSRTDNREEEERIVKVFQGCGCVVITPETTYDPSTLDGEFLWDILSAVDRNERKRIKARNARGRYTKASKGEFCGGRIPAGYVKYWEKSTGSVYCEIDESAMEPVRIAFQLTLGGVFITDVLEKLYQLGFKTRHNKPLDYGLVIYWLRNPHYAGYTHIGGSLSPKKRKDYHLFEKNMYLPPIISKEDFAKVQELLDNRLAQYHHKRQPFEHHPLVGILNCPTCDGKMIVDKRPGNRAKHGYRWYYRCNKKSKKPFLCVGELPKSVPYNVIHLLTLKMLFELRKNGYAVDYRELDEIYQYIVLKDTTQPLGHEIIQQLKDLCSRYFSRIYFERYGKIKNSGIYRITKFITCRDEIFVVKHDEHIRKILSL